MIFKSSIYFLASVLCLANLGDNFSLTETCLSSSNCGPTEYCDRDLPNPIGKCKQGYEPGSSCLRNQVCASKKCTFFTCAQRDQIQDGNCEKKLKHADCPSNQYCKKVDDRYRCVNRKCLGLCRKDAQCISNHCHLFTCVKSDTPC